MNVSNMRFLFTVALLASAFSAAAQEAFPTRAVTLIVPFPPGGVAEITGRPTAMAMEKREISIVKALGYANPYANHEDQPAR